MSGSSKGVQRAEPLGEREAQVLASLLRTSRLTSLYGPAGPGKTALLRDGVLPLLHRRATDAAVMPGLAPRVVVPFTDRRRPAGGIGLMRNVEAAVLFGDWNDAPLLRLHERLHEALGVATPVPLPAVLTLAGSMTALNRQFGARFLLILDRFDECLAVAPSFIDEVVEVLNRPLLPVNFLLALQDSAGPLVKQLRARVPGFDDQSLTLTADRAVETVTPPILRQVLMWPRPAWRALADAPAEPVGAEPPVPGPAVSISAPPMSVPSGSVPPGSAPQASAATAAGVKDTQWLASIEEILGRAAEASRQEALNEANGAGPAAEAAEPLARLSDDKPAVGAAGQAPAMAAKHAAPSTPAASVAGPAATATAADVDADADAVASIFADFPAIVARPARADTSADRATPMAWMPAAAVNPGSVMDWAEFEAAEAAIDKNKAARPALPQAFRWVAVPAAVAALVYLAWSSPPAEPDSVVAVPSVAVPSTAVPPPLGAPAVPVALVPVPEPMAAPAENPPTPAAAAAPLIAAVQPSNRIDASVSLVDGLAHALGTRASAGSVPPVAWPAGFIPLAGQPGLAVARYDALQAARADKAGGLPLQVVAPLVTEEIYFVARADSPLTFIHDIAGTRLHAGRATSAGGLTAAMLHQRLFGTPLPASATAALDDDLALGALLTGRQVDVMVLTGAHPAQWLAGLPPATARALKLLKLDRNHPADQRALQVFFPATLHHAPGNAQLVEDTPTLAVMSFLMAAGGPGEHADTAEAARTLCAKLPELRRDGHPKWREFQPGLQLDTGWPIAADAARVLQACDATMTATVTTNVTATAGSGR